MSDITTVSTLFAASRSDLDSLPSLIMALVALGIFVAIAWYILSKIRSADVNDEFSPKDMLNTFSEMYESGDLSLEEYRAIRNHLAASISNYVTAREKSEEERVSDRDMRLEQLLRGEKK